MSVMVLARLWPGESPPAHGAHGEMGIEMAKIYNVSGQARYVHGVPTGEVFVDFGGVSDNRYVRIRVQPSEEGFGNVIEVNIDGEMCAHFNDAPSLEVSVNGQLVLDTSETDVAQPRRDLPPRP